MIITTDDLSPVNLEGQFEYWDRLKEDHPDLQLLAFTTANWNFFRKRERKANRTILRDDFIDFCNERKDWLTLAYHGFDHLVPMNSLDWKGQMSVLEEMLKIFNDFEKKFKGKILNAYKPPFYKWNMNTLYACENLGIDYFFMQDGILTLKLFHFLPRNSIGLIDSHTNPECPMPDRIDLFYDALDKLLKNQSTLNLPEVPKDG